MAILLPSYLFQRIPTHMLDHVGKSELKLSLKTRDLDIVFSIVATLRKTPEYPNDK